MEVEPSGDSDESDGEAAADENMDLDEPSKAEPRSSPDEDEIPQSSRRSRPKRSTANPTSSPPSSEGSSPRRSRRLSKEKENEEDAVARVELDPAETVQPRASTVRNAERRTSTAGSTARPKSRQPASLRPASTPARRGRTSDVGITEISARELQALTSRNTTHNQTYFIELDRRVIKKDCPRPPSPSSRVRATLAPDEQDKESSKQGRADRAKRRGLMEDEMDTEDDESAGGHTPPRHFRGAGDDEDYETPKRRKVDGTGLYANGDSNVSPFAALSIKTPATEKRAAGRESASVVPSAPVRDQAEDAGEDEDEVEVEARYVKPNTRGRYVRWHKKLVFDCEKGENLDVEVDGSKGILAKDAKVSRSCPEFMPSTDSGWIGIQSR